MRTVQRRGARHPASRRTRLSTQHAKLMQLLLWSLVGFGGRAEMCNGAAAPAPHHGQQGRTGACGAPPAASAQAAACLRLCWKAPCTLSGLVGIGVYLHQSCQYEVIGTRPRLVRPSRRAAGHTSASKGQSVTGKSECCRSRQKCRAGKGQSKYQHQHHTTKASH